MIDAFVLNLLGNRENMSCALGKSSNRSLGNFNILGKINDIQKIPLFQIKVFHIRGGLSNFHFDRSIYSVSITRKERML